VIAEWIASKLPEVELVECTCCHFQFPEEILRSDHSAASVEDFVCPHCADHGHTH
jgi:hypothetical protein